MKSKADWGFDLDNLDTSVRPQDDFYRFVNGGWLDANPIPKKEPIWGTYPVLVEQSKKNVYESIKEIAADEKALHGSNRQKIRDFFNLGMNAQKLNADRTDPLRKEFEKIDSIQNSSDIITTLARFDILGIKTLWSVGVDADLRDSDKQMLYVSQGSLGMPDREYYISFAQDKEEIREKYKEFIKNMFMLLGEDEKNASSAVDTVMNIETRLAHFSWSVPELRNIEAQANYRTLEELSVICPQVEWKDYFEELGVLKNIEELLVTQLGFLAEAGHLLQTINLNDWKIYLRWNLIMGTALLLSDDFVQEFFNFYGTTLRGQKEIRPRWESCIMRTNEVLGMAVGAEYVKKHFPPEAKERINELVDNLVYVLEGRIRNLEWMTNETKEKALEKLHSCSRKLGYPENWLDYSILEIKQDSYVQNYLRAIEFESRRQLAKLGKPTDHTEWYMPPQTVNAFYDPSNNGIIFPAAVLQPPFFNVNADDALNYGAIGFTIGHELTHAFDDQGSQFDKDGNFKNWWTDKDRKEFEKRCQGIVEQFNNFEVIDGLHIRGEQTQGENIADLGGISIAYEAYQKSLEGKNEFVIDGFTSEQRFFLGVARKWCMNQRDESLRDQIVSGVHSPARFRIIGPLQNMEEFFEAFDVKKGDDMYRSPEERVKIW